MYPKIKLDILSIFFQFITFGHFGKPKTVPQFRGGLESKGLCDHLYKKNSKGSLNSSKRPLF
jgi:hypothetical protein